MKWLAVAATSTLVACSAANAPDEATLEQQHAAVWSDALFASVEEHAGCAGFHRANAHLASDVKSKSAYSASAAGNAETAAIEIAASELSEELAVQMVNDLAETATAEWAYAIESRTRPEAVLSQTEKCEALAKEQKNVVREMVKAKYGLKKQ
jgi:hypothetical protein